MIEGFCAPCVLPIMAGLTTAGVSSIKKKEKMTIIFNIISIVCIVAIMIYISITGRR